MFGFITALFNGDSDRSAPKKHHTATNGKVHQDDWQEIIEHAQRVAVEEMERGNREVNEYHRMLHGGAPKQESQREPSK